MRPFTIDRKLVHQAHVFRVAYDAMPSVVPFLFRFLDLPSAPQPGDNHMPRVSAPGFGASQRLVVSPGREEQGILTVAGGQSGHPLSPFYGAGDRDWLEGKPTPLLAGETRHTLQLRP